MIQGAQFSAHDNLEGCDRVGGRFKRLETYVSLWLIHVDVWQKPNTILQSNCPPIKNKNFFTKKVIVLSTDEISTDEAIILRLKIKFLKCEYSERKRKGKKSPNSIILKSEFLNKQKRNMFDLLEYSS